MMTVWANLTAPVFCEGAMRFFTRDRRPSRGPTTGWTHGAGSGSVLRPD